MFAMCFECPVPISTLLSFQWTSTEVLGGWFVWHLQDYAKRNRSWQQGPSAKYHASLNNFRSSNIFDLLLPRDSLDFNRSCLCICFQAAELCMWVYACGLFWLHSLTNPHGCPLLRSLLESSAFGPPFLIDWGFPFRRVHAQQLDQVLLSSALRVLNQMHDFLMLVICACCLGPSCLGLNHRKRYEFCLSTEMYSISQFLSLWDKCLSPSSIGWIK